MKNARHTEVKTSAVESGQSSSDTYESKVSQNKAGHPEKTGQQNCSNHVHDSSHTGSSDKYRCPGCHADVATAGSGSTLPVTIPDLCTVVIAVCPTCTTRAEHDTQFRERMVADANRNAMFAVLDRLQEELGPTTRPEVVAMLLAGFLGRHKGGKA